MAYEAQNFDRLLGTAGFSNQLLQNHFKLYQGYVTNTNKLMDALKALVDSDKMASPEFAELKRRFGWEFNGMRLHELYFGKMTKNGQKLNSSSSLAKQLIDQFQSLERWEKGQSLPQGRIFSSLDLFYRESKSIKSYSY